MNQEVNECEPQGIHQELLHPVRTVFGCLSRRQLPLQSAYPWSWFRGLADVLPLLHTFRPGPDLDKKQPGEEGIISIAIPGFAGMRLLGRILLAFSFGHIRPYRPYQAPQPRG